MGKVGRTFKKKSSISKGEWIYLIILLLLLFVSCLSMYPYGKYKAHVIEKATGNKVSWIEALYF